MFFSTANNVVSSKKKNIGNWWVFIALLVYTVSFQIVNKSLSSLVAEQFVLAKENKSTKSSKSSVQRFILFLLTIIIIIIKIIIIILLKAGLDWAV